jgi:hypothetical protein
MPERPEQTKRQTSPAKAMAGQQPRCGKARPADFLETTGDKPNGKERPLQTGAEGRPENNRQGQKDHQQDYRCGQQGNRNPLRRQASAQH